LQILLENIPVVVFFIDTKGTSLVSNPLYRQYVQDDVIPSSHPDGAARWVWRDTLCKRLEPALFPGARALRCVAATGVDFY
ncbi:hybrid sensor histidine kinase/response regulator, partial [Pseudomonas syringae pv. tagetis]